MPRSEDWWDVRGEKDKVKKKGRRLNQSLGEKQQHLRERR